MPETLPLFPYEEEEFVLDDWAADVEAEVVVNELRLLPGDVVGRVKGVVPQVLKCAAMDLVGARLGDNIEGRTRRATVFGGRVRGVDLDLLNEVRTDVIHQRAVGAGDLVVGSIHGKVIGIGTVSVDRLIV